MRRLLVLTVALLATSGVIAQELSEDQYWETVFRLVDDHILMDHAGVFSDSIDAAHSEWLIANHEILGGNAPGGFYARPPGSEWLERMKRLRDADLGAVVRGERTFPIRLYCIDIPPLVLRDSICGSELWPLYASWDNVTAVEGIVAAFQLARVCRDSPEACEPYLDD